MICLLTVRRLKPGSYEEFRKVWQPDPWPPQLSRAEILRNTENPDEVATIGYVDVGLDELEELRDSPDILEGEMRRIERIAPFEESILVNSIFELVEDVRP